MLTEGSPQAARVVLMMDNLNTHGFELSALCSQCLNQRMPDLATMRQSMHEWEQDRNDRQAKVDW